MGPRREEFSILTDMSWHGFRQILSAYWRGGMTQLCCRIIGEGNKGCLVAMREEHDWVELMVEMRQYCAASLYKEFEIIKVFSVLYIFRPAAELSLIVPSRAWGSSFQRPTSDTLTPAQTVSGLK